MLNLFDFSAVLQVVIAFYGVYAVKCRDIGNTLIFHIIQGILYRSENWLYVDIPDMNIR